MEKKKTSIDTSEVEHFSRLANEWWNPHGRLRMLHRLNPTRLTYIKDKVCETFKRDHLAHQPFIGLQVLDIGCGGGLLCEPLARLGANILGADASFTNIEIAKLHAAENNLQIDYQRTTAENIAAKPENQNKFDIILNMEVIEHVSDPQFFMNSVASMLKPNGLMFIATLNRTWKSWILAIIAAEYFLGWIPKGTHQYKKFLSPKELTRKLVSLRLRVIDHVGMTYNPLTKQWNQSSDMSVNYILLAQAHKLQTQQSSTSILDKKIIR
jgi:2-polyprenyl-6-hydroxyphenyl methylase/3-demethylubiquinone-9 3-methyltransferase